MARLTVVAALLCAAVCWADTTYVIIGERYGGSVLPFYGDVCDAMRCQMVYFQQELDVAGKITSFSLNNSWTQGYFYDVKVKMCNTDVYQLSSHFADNYGGNAPTTVLTEPVMLVGSGQYETWYPFECSAPFCYYNTGNLLIEFTWNGDNGHDVDFYTTENGGGGAVWTDSDTASNGTPSNTFMYARVGFVPFRLQGNLLSPVGRELWPGGTSRIISWTVAPKDFDHGRLLLSTDGGGTFSIVLDASVPPSETTRTITVPTVNSASCRAKFQAMDSSGEIAFEDISDSNFTVDSQNPSAPSLVYPPSGGAINVTSVVSRWHRASDNLSGVASYTVQVAYDSAFGAMVDTARCADTTYTHDLPADTSFYWRVRATDRCGNVGMWSQTWKFEIDVQTPEVPSLLEPAAGQWFRSSTVQFHWSPVSFRAPTLSAVRYIIQLDTVQSIRPLYTDTTAVVYDTFSSLPEHRYWWRVRAYDLAGNQGAFSAIQGFGIDMTGPLIPTLVYPPHLGGISTDTTSLIWRASHDSTSGTELYHVQLAHDSSFADTIDLSPGPTLPDTSVVANLPSMTDYYWRARARDTAGNWCNWSLVRQFTCGVGVAESPNKLPRVAHMECQPNPSSGRTVVKLALPSPTAASVAVYDAVGVKVAALWNGRVPAGLHSFNWNARAPSGRALGPGVYYVRVSTGQWTRVTSVRVVR